MIGLIAESKIAPQEAFWSIAALTNDEALTSKNYRERDRSRIPHDPLLETRTLSR